MSDLNRSIKIYIDGSDAQAGIAKVETAVQKLEQQLRSLNKSEADYEAKSEKLKAELTAKNRTLENYRKKVEETDRVLKNLSGATYNELLSVQKQLRKELNAAVPGTEKYTRTMEQYQRVARQTAAAQQAMRVEVGAQGSLWSRAADGFNRYAGVVAGGIATLTGMTLTMRQCVDEYAKMEEAESQVLKYTGMTREEVRQLNEQLKSMDTRTPREELNRLAGEAGKLGITGVDNVREFVEAADMINVALGEDLGEEAVNSIGKLSQMFGDESRSLKENMLAIGSAVNQVAQSTSASEPYLVSFTARMGGVGKQANMAVTDIMGFASALDQNMLRSEMASTALSGLIMRIYQEPAKYAKLAQMDVRQFTQLVETDVNGAVLAFLESLSKMGGMAQIAPVLKEMQLSGAEAASVITTLAGNVELVRREQANANQAFREGTSILNEYTVQNNTVQAGLDKARNKFQEVRVELGEKLQPLMKDMISLGSLTVKGLLQLISIYNEYRGAIVTTSATLAVYTLAVNAHAIATKAAEVRTKALTVATRLLNTVTKASPWGLVVAAATAAVTAFAMFRQKTVDVTASIREMNKEIGGEQARLDHLFTSLKTANEGTQLRSDLIKAINEQYGQYMPYLLTEKSTLDDIEAVYRRINGELTRQIAMKYKQQDIEEVTGNEGGTQVESIEEIRQSVLSGTGSRTLANAAIADLKEITASFYEEGMRWQEAYGQAYHSIKTKYFGNRSMANFAHEDMEAYIESYYRMQKQLEEINEKYANWENPAPSNVIPEVVVTASKKKKEPQGVGYTPVDSDADKKRVEQLNTQRDDALHQQALTEQASLNVYRQSLQQKQLTQEQYEVMAAILAQQGADNRLAIETDYYQKTQALALTDGEVKADAERESAQRVDKAKQESFDKRLAAEQAYLKNMEAMQKMASGNKQESPEAQLDAEHQAQLALLESYYKASLEYAGKYGQSEADVTKAYNDAKIRLEEQYQKERKDILNDADKDEQRKQSLLHRLGLTSQKEELEKQLEQLKQYLAEGLLTQEEYEQAVQNVKRDSYKKQADYYTNLFSNVVSSLQDAELARIDAKYDAEIAAAEGNSEEVERLENEKEAKKLEVQKKYADVNFAVKVSQIIADTAVSIMKAFADLGPIAGAIAAAMLSATGAAQLMIAKAERDKVKNMTAGGSSSSSGSGGYRHVATGTTVAQHATGRYDVIGREDGKRYRGVPYIGPAPTGIVSSPALISENGAELIVNADDLNRLRRHINYPLVVQAIEESRRPSSAPQVPQHAQGNYPLPPAKPSATAPQTEVADPRLLNRLTTAIERLERNGVSASVVLTELERKQQLRNRARKIGSKR